MKPPSGGPMTGAISPGQVISAMALTISDFWVVSGTASVPKDSAMIGKAITITVASRLSMKKAEATISATTRQCAGAGGIQRLPAAGAARRSGALSEKRTTDPTVAIDFIEFSPP